MMECLDLKRLWKSNHNKKLQLMEEIILFFFYELDMVTDEDVKMPDLSEYKIERKEN